MTLTTIIQKVSQLLSITPKQIEATWQLLADGATIPFVSRYRKEVTGGLDEVQIAQIRDEMQAAIELEKRREFILNTIDEQGNLSPELKSKIEKAKDLQTLEDLYLPFKPKRKTKATVAKEKGLEPLAKIIFEQRENADNKAGQFVNAKKEVASEEEALEGARHIVSEWISERAEIREKIRNIYKRTALISSKVMKSKMEEAQKFKDYFEWSEPLAKTPSHRLLAMRRGEKEGFLMLKIEIDKDEALRAIENDVFKGGQNRKHLDLASEDAFKRLIKPALETEFRLSSKKLADEAAIHVFAENLVELLMASPFGQKRILALDPGFRTGCKVVALNAEGKLEDHDVVYPNEPQRKTHEAEALLKAWVDQYQIEAIAIGNGTASRETESFVKKIKFEKAPQIIVVNESGASIYSASEVAREEFPDHDVTVRGAVSIGRRLADPLAELVKIDPKSIGVGQYQHDVDQTALKKQLDEVVMSCVNKVGVDVNTASKELLTYVSGLGPVLAQNIINYRNENGAFDSRKALMKVPRMGAKVFEQAAGFLRIRDGKEVLDNTAVHPERYALVKTMAKNIGADIPSIIKDSQTRSRINIKNYVSDEVGLPTLQDILEELEKPGRDPRQAFEVFEFAEGIEKPEDLHEGMELNGIVTNVTKFGAFVDVGVHQDGLVHISHLADKFVSDPADIVKVNQKVRVRVLEVDLNRKRISLSMKFGQTNSNKPKPKKNQSPQQEGSMADKLAALKGNWGK